MAESPHYKELLRNLNGYSFEFESAWTNRVESKLFGKPANFIALDDLIANKEGNKSYVGPGGLAAPPESLRYMLAYLE